MSLAAVDISPRPDLREVQAPDRAVIITRTLSPFAPPSSMRPQPRGSQTYQVAQAETLVSRGGIRFEPVLSAMTSPRPIERPRVRIVRPVATASAVRPLPGVSGRVAKLKGERICRDNSIRGRKISSIPGKLRGCGVRNPVQVISVDGVPLSRAATMDCDTARALKTWVQKGVKPAVGRLGGGVASLKVAAHYSCRTRNNRPGGKISEHGKGRAIDISAINLQNGRSLSVLTGWRDPVQGKVLKKMHKTACGPFGTVLGPNSDRYHKDHFHLDTARHGRGPYCR
ncbi:MAG: extensin family protein [Litoreibacter sp.]|nr:extensin family protein [Litoreibacter sp.]